MTEQTPTFWIGRLNEETNKLAQRGLILERSERLTRGGNKQIVERQRSATPELQAAADAGHKIAIHLNGQLDAMSSSDKRAFYTAADRHARALLEIATPEHKPAVQKMLDSAQVGLRWTRER